MTQRGGGRDVSPWRRRPSRPSGVGRAARRGVAARGQARSHGEKQLIRFASGPTFFNFVKPKWQTIGDTIFFHLPYVLGTCQITRFAKSILTNSWRCDHAKIATASKSICHAIGDQYITKSCYINHEPCSNTPTEVDFI